MANLKSISHTCHPVLLAFLWELTEETIDLPLGCLPGVKHETSQPCALASSMLLPCSAKPPQWRACDVVVAFFFFFFITLEPRVE